jgi:hypothetical protein
LIRKKQYGSTSRPNHILDDEEPLISFPDSKHGADVNIKDTGVFPSKSSKKDAIIICDEEIQTSVSPETEVPAEGPIEPLAETCSDNAETLLESTEPTGQTPQPEITETSSFHDTKPVEELTHDSARDPFADVMRLEASFTKESHDSCSENASAESSEGGNQSSDLANASEGDLWTHSSTTDVDSEDIASPMQSSSRYQQDSNLPGKDIIRTSDRPKAIDNAYKTNKPIRITKSLADSLFAHDSSSGDDGPPPQLEVTPGTILVAQNNFPKTTLVHVDVCSGDSIKIIKKVSGIMYHGQNLRTKLTGQFPSSIFQNSSRERKKHPIERQRAPVMPRPMASTRHTGLSGSSAGNELDKVEDLNAAEWDKDDVSVVTNSATVISSTRGSVGGRYSVFANLDDQSQCSDATQQEILQAMMSKMLDEKVCYQI